MSNHQNDVELKASIASNHQKVVELKARIASNHQNDVELKASIASNYQNDVELKSSIAEFVGPICKRLKLFKEQVPMSLKLEKTIDEISTEIKMTNNIVVSRGNRDRKLTRDFGQIERQIDYWVDNNDRLTEWDECAVRTDLMKVHNQLSHNLRVEPLEAGTKPHENASDLPQKYKKTEMGESSNISHQENKVSMLLEYLKSLNPLLRQYLYSLGIFAEKTVLKKRLLIYWWIGLGLLPFKRHRSRTAEQLGEIFFSDLVHDGILIPKHTREYNQVIDRCTIEPTFHKHLISLCKKHGKIISKEWEEGTLYFYDSKVLLNLDQMYLKSKDIRNLYQMYNLHVVQLGSWCYTETEFNDGVKETRSKETKSKDHIEVDETDFLRKLRGQVTYLSLRGISGIEELPESTGKLENLMILDLRACHNLEKLPQKPSSRLKPNLIKWALPKERWFNKLTVLDISECYLLDHMPEWISELSNLEVLKGFVVGREGNKNRSCQIGDLSKLHKLRKLCIRFAKDNLGSEDISGLNSLKNLLVLTIIWGKTKSISIPSYSFPEKLEKLDLRCYPIATATELLNPAKLKNLKRLYIRGGELTEIPYNDIWKVEILRLRFLKKLEIDWDKIKNIKYVEYLECPKLNNPSQNAQASEISNQ